MRTRLLKMTWSNLRFNVWRSFVTMPTNLPSCFSIQFLEQFLKFLVNFTLLKCVKSQRSYGFLITKELIFGVQILDLKDHFSTSLMRMKLYFSSMSLTISGDRLGASPLHSPLSSCFLSHPIFAYLPTFYCRAKISNTTQSWGGGAQWQDVF